MRPKQLCWSLWTNRVRLVVSYDGTDFSGWAPQKGRRTVQRTLKDAVRQVSGEDCEIIGASRTDAGAHALGQVCHFDCGVGIEPENWARALNKLLPGDVSVLKSSRAYRTFHSRFSAQNRHYRYRILMNHRDAWRGRYVYETWRQLDASQMHRAAQVLVGRNDFKGFSEELEPGQNTIRVLESIAVTRRRDEIHVDVVAQAFLRGMMRRITGALYEVGRGSRQEREIALLLDFHERDNLQWPVVLPAKGLTLMKVKYGRHPVDHRNGIEEDFGD